MSLYLAHEVKSDPWGRGRLHGEIRSRQNFSPVRRVEILLRLHDKFQPGLNISLSAKYEIARVEWPKYQNGAKDTNCENRRNTVLRNLAWLSIFNFLGWWQPTRWWKWSKTCLVMVWWQEAQRKSIRLHISEPWLPEQLHTALPCLHWSHCCCFPFKLWNKVDIEKDSHCYHLYSTEIFSPSQPSCFLEKNLTGLRFQLGFPNNYF